MLPEETLLVGGDQGGSIADDGTGLVGVRAVSDELDLGFPSLMEVAIKLRREGNSEPYRSPTEEAIELLWARHLVGDREVGTRL